MNRPCKISKLQLICGRFLLALPSIWLAWPAQATKRCPQYSLVLALLLTAGGNMAQAADVTLAEGEPIQPVLAAMQPGDTLNVPAGDYSGDIQVPQGVTLNGTCGEDGWPLTILDGTVRIWGVDNVTVSCIEAGHNLRGYGFDVNGPAHHITLLHTVARDTQSSGYSVWGVPWRETPDDYDWAGITDFQMIRWKAINVADGGSNEKITIANGVDGCEIAHGEMYNDRPVSYRYGGEGLDLKIGISNCHVHHNYFHDTGKIAIYLDAAGAQHNPVPPISANNLVEYNLIERCNVGISISTEGSGYHKDLIVRRNVVRDCGSFGLLVYRHPYAGRWAPPGQSAGVFEGVTLTENISCGQGRRDAQINNSTAIDVVWRDNRLCYDGGLWVASAGPGFVNENNGPDVAVPFDISEVGPQPEDVPPEPEPDPEPEPEPTPPQAWLCRAVLEGADLTMECRAE